MQKELEKEDGKAWKDNRVIYIEGKSIFLTIRKSKNKSYRKIMN